MTRQVLVWPLATIESHFLTEVFLEFKRGNLINIAFAATAFLLWFAQKNAYRYRNARNAATLSKLSEEELAIEEDVREVKGNEGPLFRFTTWA